jgi:hypothetical protein
MKPRLMPSALHRRLEVRDVLVQLVLAFGPHLGPMHIGRAYFGVPPDGGQALRGNDGKILRSAGAFRGLSPPKPV